MAIRCFCPPDNSMPLTPIIVSMPYCFCSNFDEEIKKLPYIFKDPVKFDKKIDPKLFNFGSKIDNSTHKREAYYTVKEIISPAVLVLNNGLRVKLLGVKEKEENREDAIKFLREKTQGQKVFMRFDSINYDKDNNLLCYLYLWNKTFLNAHLIKENLVYVDTSVEYKYKKQFLNLRKEQVKKV